MKESYDEGVANHIDPESCAEDRKGLSEALTGARAGRVWSRVILLKSREPTWWDEAEGNNGVSIVREAFVPCAVVDPGHARKHPARESGDPMAAFAHKGTEAASGSPRT